MDNDYSQRPDPFVFDVENEREAPRISPPSAYSSYFPPVPIETAAHSSVNGPTQPNYSDNESGVSPGMPRRSASLLPPPRNPQQLSSHHFTNPSFYQNDQFPERNSFSEQQEPLPHLAMAGQDFTDIRGHADLVNLHIDPQGNSQATSSFISSPSSDTQGSSYEASNPYFSVYENTAEFYGRMDGYNEVPITLPENETYGSSSSDPNHTAVGATASVIPPYLMDQMSHLSNTEEAPLSSNMVSPYCLTCNPPKFLDNLNCYYLHYWGEHPPPPSSLEAWRPRPCLWDTCKLKKNFKTYKAWLDHAYAVHFRRFPCPVNGCDVFKPFGSQNTLNRHIRTIHHPPELCKIPGCQGSKNKLSRRDKREGHKASFHGPLVCEVAGCPRGRINGQNHGFTEPEELNKHMKSKHKYLRG